MRLQKAISCIATILASSSAQTYQDSEVHEQLSHIPHGWELHSSPLNTSMISLSLAVRQSRAYEFERHVIDISTPASTRYRHFMSRDEVKEWLNPSAEVSKRLFDWLTSSGINDVQNNGNWINFVGSIDQIERLLDTNFHTYRHPAHGTMLTRAVQYSLPSGLRQHIQTIQPTTRFGQPQARSVGSKLTLRDQAAVTQRDNPEQYPHSCNLTVTPDCLRTLYGLGDFRATANVGNKIGISGYLEQYVQDDQLELFFSEFASYGSKQTVSHVSINGGLNIQNITTELMTEANLDTQWAMSLTYPTPAIFYSTGGRGPLIPDLDQPSEMISHNEPYLDQVLYILNLPDHELPTVLTTSYGEDEQNVPEEYANLTCSLFAQLGARGVSVIFASGDTGVGIACQTNDGKNRTRFLPTFPASCPFVTSVGGTGHVKPEMAAPFSSGGFSDLFPRPTYQDEAVGRYLDQLGGKWKGLYNAGGRGIPDVATAAQNLTVVDNGTVILDSGTSASAPIFAAVISNVNNVLMSQSKPPLGFLNPFLYSRGLQGLTDVVHGGSRGCFGKDLFSGLPTPHVPHASWNATQGWDPVTGLGTPNFPRLVALAGGLLPIANNDQHDAYVKPASQIYRPGVILLAMGAVCSVAAALWLNRSLLFGGNSTYVQYVARYRPIVEQVDLPELSTRVHEVPESSAVAMKRPHQEADQRAGSLDRCRILTDHTPTGTASSTQHDSVVTAPEH